MDEKTLRDFVNEIIECVAGEDLSLPREGPPREGIRRHAVSTLEGSRRRFVALGQDSFSMAQRGVLHLGSSDQVVQLLEVTGSRLYIANVQWVDGTLALLNGYVKLERLFEEVFMVWIVDVLRARGHTLFVHCPINEDHSYGAYHLCVVYRGETDGT